MKKERFNDGWYIGPKTSFLSMGTQDVRAVTVPHDAMIYERRQADIKSGHYRAYFPSGQYEYTKRFTLPREYQNKRVFLEFEGVYMNAEVFINGQYAGGRPYGYSNFFVDVEPFLKFGEENTVRVTAENADDHRWYSGAGIYRNVYLITGEPRHFALNGVKITTVDIEEDYAVIEIENNLESDDHTPKPVQVVTEIFNSGNELIAQEKTPVTFFSGKTKVLQRLIVKNPCLWDTDSPRLYTCKSTIVAADTVIDTENNTFGIRILKLDTRRGLTVNGKTVKLRGACIHHDNGVIGATAFERAEERRVEILKEAGFNAIRSAHNPLSKAMLDACDRIGMLVMDEAFDTWTIGKTSQDYSRYFTEWWERDIEAMVEKDYNHPCVVLYSIGNEIPDTGKPQGAQWGRKLAEKIRSMDRSRFIINSINGMMSARDELAPLMTQPRPEGETGDINNMMVNMGAMMKQFFASEIAAKATEESFACVDVAGYNYMDPRYEKDGKLYPHRVICGSETFPSDIASSWRLVEKLSYVIGDFTWTGWDYLGEVGIGKVEYNADGVNNLSGGYPWITAWCGDMDITGFRRPVSYYREIVWGLRREPYIAVLKPEYNGQKTIPSPWAWSDSVSTWTWPGFEGKPIQVEVYSDSEEAALFLNGREIGRAPAGKDHQFKAVFDTVYQSGKLEAVSYSDGKETGRFTLIAAGSELEFTAKSDRKKLRIGSGDLAYITIALTDKAGVVNTATQKKLTVTIEGAGVLQGLGSGNPITDESYTDAEHTTFEGRALAVIRSTGRGTISVTISADGLTDTDIHIEAV